MQRDGWWSSARRLADLDSPEAIGKEAAPAYASPARSAAGSHATGSDCLCAGGGAVARRVNLRGGFGATRSGAGLLSAGKLGELIAAPSLTIIDDSTMLLPTWYGRLWTSPFDGEGLPSRRTVVGGGVLRNYLLNTYTARKLGMKSTHNASRGLAGAPESSGNLYWKRER